ncbi:hypothetical protein FRC10_001547 [Ceratobasidium sp. 414]|nr:hypothetical protein FRC10_001547 [Ceratobasidium sp. 414]
MNLHDIAGLRSSKHTWEERDDFIGSSLASSGRLSERMLTWSGSNDRGRLFPMKFHQEWQHNNCPVMGWYNQQRKSSTCFRTIEHRQNVERPFLHEFLLLKLEDGAICRVERTGDGSRIDAIRYVGCAAHDLIQWFTNSDYEQFSAKYPSTLMAKVDLYQEFDILDVLAVCYSIQNTKACRVYTLQRYNCYFLCLTVLTMLTRRVVNWETMISRDNWDSSISALLDRLSNLSPDDLRKYPTLRFCALLEPDNPRPGRFIINGLREHLTSQPGALNNYNLAMSLTLWQTDRKSTLRNVLSTLLEPAVPAILDDPSYCATQFKHAARVSPEDSIRAMQSDGVLVKQYLKVVSKEADLAMAEAVERYKKHCRMREIEHPVPFGKQILSQLLFPLGGVLSLLVPASIIFRGSTINRVSIMLFPHLPWATRVMVGSLVASKLFLHGSDEVADEIDDFGAAQGLATEDLLEDFLTKLLDEAAHHALGPSQLSLGLATLATPFFLAKSFASLLASDLYQTLDGMPERRQAEICLLSASQDDREPCNTPTTIIEFQETYIKGRIDDQANRVALHQLAAAPLVRDDIFSTMTDVWKLLPSGFGGTVEPA